MGVSSSPWLVLYSLPGGQFLSLLPCVCAQYVSGLSVLPEQLPREGRTLGLFQGLGRA